jgi:hypothetical protein
LEVDDAGTASTAVPVVVSVTGITRVKEYAAR